MDALVIILALGGLLWAFWKLPWWRWFWIFVAILLGGFELASELCLGKTISQQFWEFHALHPATGWTAIAALAAFCILLVLHLAWKQLRRR